jgi:exodeoxyribonuclease III
MSQNPLRGPVKVLSWNVNGLRAIAEKGFRPWLASSQATIVCVQEVRARAEQLPMDLREPSDWHAHFVAGTRPGYAGVGLFTTRKPDTHESALNKRRFDIEGRMQVARFGRLTIINAYFPNGNGRERDNSRVPYKLAFSRAVFELAERRRRAGQRVLVLGDINTAHQALDLARPKQNLKTSGFLTEERETTEQIVALNILIVLPFSFGLALLDWQWPSWTMLALGASHGALGTIAHVCMARAFRHADASFCMPFDFTRLPLVALIAYPLFGQLPDLWTMIGAAVIFSATLYVTLRERAN